MNVHRPLLRVALAVWMVVVAASLACLFTLLLIRLGLLNPPSVSVIHGPVAITAEGERVYANGRRRTFYSIWIVVRPRTYRQIVKVEVPNRGAPAAWWCSRRSSRSARPRGGRPRTERKATERKAEPL